MNGDEDLAEDITMKGDKFHYAQKDFHISLAQAAARAQSGVRARWVELPDCVGATGANNSVPLKDDLSNAVIATCKGKRAGVYDPNAQYAADQTLPANLPDDPTAGNANAGQQLVNDPAPQIWDARVTAKKHNFEEWEHHVTQTQDGTVEQTDGSQGPHGDFSLHGKPLAPNQWPQPTPSVSLLATETNLESFEEVFKAVIHKTNSKSKYVELPDCSGKDGEVWLKTDLSNTTQATCKINPEKSIPPSASSVAEDPDDSTHDWKDDRKKETIEAEKKVNKQSTEMKKFEEGWNRFAGYDHYGRHAGDAQYQ